MADSDDWVDQALQYRPIIYEYCQLALRPTLTDAEAVRLGEILAQAEASPLLSFLVDEADYLIAQHQNLICNQYLQQQQRLLLEAMDAVWITELINQFKLAQLSHRLGGWADNALS